MSTEVKTGLWRSLLTVIPVGLLLAASLAIQLFFPTNPEAKTILTASLMSLATVMPLLTRGVVEGLADSPAVKSAAPAMQAALSSPVADAVAQEVVSTVAPVVATELTKAGVPVTSAQVAGVADAFGSEIKTVVEEVNATPAGMAPTGGPQGVPAAVDNAPKPNA